MKNYTTCPICENDSFSKYLECTDYTVSKKSFKIDECDNCNFRFTNPIPLEDKIGRFYESDEYISHSNTNKGIISQLYQKVRSKTLEDKYNLIQSDKQVNKLLDIGCGTGEFLNKCKSKGLVVKGIEPSEQARNQAITNYKLEVEEESYLNKIDNDSYDVITMWHVLEHVYHLNERLQQLKRIIKNEGSIYIAVPNHLSLDAETYQKYWAAYDVPRHLYHFKPKDISTLAQKHGFDLVNKYPMKYDAYYVSMLSEKYQYGSTNYLRAFKVGLKSNIAAKKSSNYSSLIYQLKLKK